MTTELIFGVGAQAKPLAVKRSARAKRMGLAVDSLGRVRLTLPPRAPLGSALAWAETKRDWVEAQLARLPIADAITPGMTIEMGGESLILDWAPAYPRTPARIGGSLRIGGPRDLMAPRLLRWMQREAKTLLTAESLEFAEKAGVSVTTIGVGDPRSRWGSCSSAGAIRYSWRLILAPDFVRRATVAHEIAHRVHMDHSPRFHALVAKLLQQDPAPARRWLRTNAAQLHGFGRAA